MKAVLSQTAFCGAVHMHGKRNGRLLADLDCNGWPQTGRAMALEEIRRVRAVHLCGDQHLAVVVKHGIASERRSVRFHQPGAREHDLRPMVAPARREARPEPRAEQPAALDRRVLDGLGNKIRMLAYANPEAIMNEKKRADGYGVVRFNKKSRKIVIECWPRFADAKDGAKSQFPGWPITINVDDNDGRKPTAWLPELSFGDVANPVVQVIEEKTGEVISCVRVVGKSYQPGVFAPGKYTIRIGKDKPTGSEMKGVEAGEKAAVGKRELKL